MQMQSLSPFSLRKLFVVVCLVNTTIAFGGPLEDFARDSHLLSSPDSRAFIGAMVKSPWPFENVGKSDVHEVMKQFEKKIQKNKSNMNFELTWDLFSSNRKPIF
jgi:hypothetical protein